MKKLTSMLLSVLFIASALQAIAFAYGEKGFFNPTKVGDYTIVYTERYPHAAPRTGRVYLYGKCGVLDKDGMFVVEPIYNHISAPVCGRAKFSIYSETDKMSRCGYFDESWNIALEPIYSQATDFSEGLAVVSFGRNYNDVGYGCIDTDGNMVVPMIYDEIRPAKDGKVSVYIKETVLPLSYRRKLGVYDTSGNLLEQPIFRHSSENRLLKTYVNPITINGNTIDNSTLAYPIASHYKSSDGPYLPLTYDMCRALGIGISYTQESGLCLWRDEITVSDYGKGTSVMPQNGDAFVPLYGGEITINGEKYSNENIPIPLLYYENIVYFPLYWSKATNELGIRYWSTLENGMTIDTVR